MCDPLRGVANIGRLFTEDSPQQLLLGAKLRFAFRSDLAYEDVAGADLSGARVIAKLSQGNNEGVNFSNANLGADMQNDIDNL